MMYFDSCHLISLLTLSSRLWHFPPCLALVLRCEARSIGHYLSHKILFIVLKGLILLLDSVSGCHIVSLRDIIQFISVIS